MKRFSLATSILLVGLFVGACGGASLENDASASDEPVEDPSMRDPEDPCPSLVGSWELVSIDDESSALSGDFGSDPDYQVAPTLKILNDTHWMFIRQSADRFIHAQGGRYTLHDGIYTEMVDYSAIPENVGLDFVFECRLEGDSLWYHTGGLGDHRYIEVWRRVK